MRKKILFMAAALALGGASARSASDAANQERQALTLAGIWQFKLDPTNVAIPVKGSRFTPQLPETIRGNTRFH